MIPLSAVASDILDRQQRTELLLAHAIVIASDALLNTPHHPRWPAVNSTTARLSDDLHQVTRLARAHVPSFTQWLEANSLDVLLRTERHDPDRRHLIYDPARGNCDILTSGDANPHGTPRQP